MKVGLIGLGAMGLGIANNLAKAGLLTTIYNRTQSKAEALAAELNIEMSASPQLLAQQVNIILICVSADDDVLEIIDSLVETITPESVVIDLSTVSSDTAIEAAQILSHKQVNFLDAPVSGGVEGAKKGTLSVMVGGDESILKQVSPILAAISEKITYMGSTGTGQGTKAVNQIMAAGINQAVTSALSFAQAQELDMEKVIDVISNGAAANWFLEHRGTSMVKRSFEPGFKLSLHYKDLMICHAMASQTGQSIDFVNKTLGEYSQLMAQGLGNEDISALYRLK